MSYLSAPSKRVFEAAWKEPVIPGNHKATKGKQLAAALRALTTTASVRSALFGEHITFAVSVEELLTIAKELEAINK